MFITEILTRLKQDERGATVIEYALIITLLSLVIVGAAGNLANGTNGTWTTASSKVDAAIK